MTPREANHHSHVCCPQPHERDQSCAFSCTGHNRKVSNSDPHFFGMSRALFHSGTFDPRAPRSRGQLTSLFVASVGVVSCEQYSADRSPGRGRSTGSPCGALFRIRNINKFSGKTRTNLSVPSRASTASASISATSRAWPGQTRPNRTSLSSRASTRALRAVGCRMTTNPQPTRSASCLPRS